MEVKVVLGWFVVFGEVVGCRGTLKWLTVLSEGV